jgi:hypothetical protein
MALIVITIGDTSVWAALLFQNIWIVGSIPFGSIHAFPSVFLLPSDKEKDL